MFRRCLLAAARRLSTYGEDFSKPAPPTFRSRPVTRRLFGAEATCVGFSLFTWLGFDKTTQEDEIVMDLKRSILLIQKQEYDKAEQMLHLTLRLAQQTINRRAILYAYDLMANLAMVRGEYDKAEKLFVEVMQRLIANGVPENSSKNVHISLKLAHICALRGDYERADVGFKWCLQHLESVQPNSMTDEERQLLALAKNWYGLMFYGKKDYKTASDYILEAHEMMKESEEMNLSEDHALLLNDLATITDILGESDIAIDYLNQGIAIGTELPGMKSLGALYVNIGRLYLKRKVIDKARKSCGYGLRLGKDRKNEDVREEARKCLREVASVS